MKKLILLVVLLLNVKESFAQRVVSVPDGVFEPVRNIHINPVYAIPITLLIFILYTAYKAEKDEKNNHK